MSVSLEATPLRPVAFLSERASCEPLRRVLRFRLCLRHRRSKRALPLGILVLLAHRQRVGVFNGLLASIGEAPTRRSPSVHLVCSHAPVFVPLRRLQELLKGGCEVISSLVPALFGGRL